MTVSLKTRFILGMAAMSLSISALWVIWHIIWFELNPGDLLRFWPVFLLFLLSLTLPLWLAVDRWVLRTLAYFTWSNAEVTRGNLEGAAIPDGNIPKSDIGDMMRSHNAMLDSLVSSRRKVEAELAERERVETELKQSKERLNLALDAAHTGIWESDLNTGEVRWSESVGPLFGFSQDTSVSTREDLYERFHPDDRERVRRAAARAVEENSEFDIEHRVVWPDGTVRWLAKKGKVLYNETGMPVRMLGTLVDVTERRQMEEAIRGSEDQLKQQARQQEALLRISRQVQEIRRPSDLEQVVQTISEALRDYGLDFYALVIHRMIDADTRAFESYEVRPSVDAGHLVRPLPNVYRMWQAGKVVYRPDLDIDAGGMLPEDVAKLRRRYGMPVRCILDIPHARGTLAMLSVQPNAFSESHRHFLELVADSLSLGISRVEDQESLAVERDRVQNYLDVAGVAIVALDAHGKVTLINRKGCEILGYAEREIIGENWFDRFLPESHREHVQAVFSSLIAGEVEPVEYFENPVVTKGGEERLIAWHNSV